MHTRELLTITAALALLVAPLAKAQTNQTAKVEQPAEWSFDPADTREIDVKGTVKVWLTTALGLAAGWLGLEQLDVSEKDRQDKVTQEKADAAAMAAAKQAEERTLVYGPSTPIRYNIIGTFAGARQVALGGAEWSPSITFGNQSSTKGGSIASYTLPPSAAGMPEQVVNGLGAWSISAENEINIEGAGIYTGKAKLANVPPPGTFGSGNSMTTQGGLYLSGGSVTAFEVQP